MKVKFLILLFILVIAGCTEPSPSKAYPNRQHGSYLEDAGWHINRFLSETKYAADTLPSFEDQLSPIIKHSRIDLTPFLHRDVVESEYVLEETTDRFNQIIAHLFATDEQVIGGYLAFNHIKEQSDGTIQVESGKITPMIDATALDAHSILGQLMTKR